MRRLNDKLCVVTGAARGIGRAIAASFHDEGAGFGEAVSQVASNCNTDPP
ncbi:hypothetical protein [Mesorhizobium sp. M0488]